MMDLKDILLPSNFTLYGYIVATIHFLVAIIFVPVAFDQKKSERDKFKCDVDEKISSSTASQEYYEECCSSQYEKRFNFPNLPFSWFTALNFGTVLMVYVIYALIVRFFRERSTRDRERSCRNNHESQSPRRPRTCRVFLLYFIMNLGLQFLLRILFIALQLELFYPASFPSQFVCVTCHNITNVNCYASSAVDKNSSARALWILNVIFAVLLFLEMVYIAWKARRKENFMYDPDFYEKCFFKGSEAFRHLSQDDNTLPSDESELSRGNRNEGNTNECDVHLAVFPDESDASVPAQDEQNARKSAALPDVGIIKSIGTYIQNVIARCKDFDINIAKMNLDKGGGVIPLDKIYVDFLITTKRENCSLENSQKREKIYQQYTEYPPEGIVIENVQELFSAIEDDNDGKQPRTILVVGQPGIGKSVLCQKLMYDWAKENDQSSGKLPNTVTIRLQFRSLDNSRLFNIKELLAEGTNLPTDDPIHEYLLKNPNELRLIFDGLDEMKVKAGWKKEAEKAKDSQGARMSISSLFYKFVKGTLLNGSTVLVTTRQTAEDIYSMLPFDRRTEIIGFTPNKAEKYVEQFCRAKGVEDKRNTIWSQINESPLLLNLCYVPVNCFIVCLTLVMSIGSPGSPLELPRTITLTDLYQRAIRFIVSEHHPAYKDREKKADYMENDISDQSTKNTLEELEKLAYDGMKENQLVFDKLHNDDSVSEDMANFGLLNQLPTRNEMYQYCFLHLTIQEFLAAKFISRNKSFEEIEEFILTMSAGGKWQVVIQFLYGLLKKRADINEIRKHLSSSLIQICTVRVKVTSEVCSTRALFVFKCLYELQEDEIAKKTLKVVLKNLFNDSDISLFNVTSVDMLSIIYCLSHVPSKLQCELRLHLHQKSMSDGSVELLSNALERRMSYLRSLELIDGDITDARVKVLCNALNNGQCELTNLNLSFNKITDTGVEVLCNALNSGQCKLTNLNLRRNEITDTGVEVLCNALNSGQCKLTNLDVGYNKITDKGAEVLCNALDSGQCKLTNLNLCRNEITDTGVEVLCNALISGQCKLTNLDLGYNRITDKGAKVLGNALISGLCKLTSLILHGNGITDAGVDVLCNALNSGQCMLTNLSLHAEEITDKEVELLRDALNRGQCKWTYLDLHGNEITDAGVEVLCNAPNRGQWKLTSSDLGHDRVTDANLQQLCDAVNSGQCELPNSDITNRNITRASERDLKNYDCDYVETAHGSGARHLPCRETLD